MNSTGKVHQRAALTTPDAVARFRGALLRLQSLPFSLHSEAAWAYRAAQAQENTMENTIENNRSPLPGIDVLNTGYGDFELRFDPDEPDEVQKAKETITDMLKRGYAIFVRQGQETLRVRKFDVNKNVYIIGL